MKTVFLTFTSLLTFYSLGQLTPALPEYNFLYKSYPNKMIVNAGCYDSIQVLKDEEIIRESTFQVYGDTSIKGYIVNPSSIGLVHIIINGYEAGRIVSSDTTDYLVKTIPPPVVVSGEISKTSGVSLYVAVPSYVHLPDINYTIIGGVLMLKDGLHFIDNIIPGNYVTSVNDGDKIPVVVRVRSNTTHDVEIIRGLLEVTP